MSLIQTNPIPKQDDRQDASSAEVRFDFTAAGTTVATHAHPSVFTIPAGARVIGGEVVVDAAWANGAGTVTLDIGDGVDPNRYTGTAVNLKTAGRTQLTLTGYRYAETDGIDFEIVVATAATTAGAGYVRIAYVVEGRSEEVQE